VRFHCAAAVAAGVLLLCACATPQTKRLTEAPPPDLPMRVMLKGVPFIAQQAYYCGPAALAMAMRFYGLDVSQASLARAVYIPELKGSLQAEMLAATRRHGLLAYVLTPNLQSLLEEIAAGHPVVILQNLGVSWYPVWHYAVVIGYDLGARKIVLNTGRNPAYRASLSTFERTWARSRYWALVPLPPSSLPRDKAPLRMLEAAAALEQTGELRAAKKAYMAAGHRWPRNLIARMGIGNTRYALGKIDAAVRAFRAAIAVDPHSAAAYNNLAVGLSKLGCHRDAIEAARRAVALGDKGTSSFRKTLREVSNASPAEIEPARCAALGIADAGNNVADHY
jgi:tetratricopeptide (TPR) repeat protein